MWSFSRRASARGSLPSSFRESDSSALSQESDSSSCSASARRARKSSASSALGVRPRIPAISAYERPSNSRITIAERCVGVSFWSARRTSATLGSLRSSGSAARASVSSSSTSIGLPSVRRKCCRIWLCAIVSSQFSALRGLTPCASARYAFMNVVCVTSSASAWLPSTARL